jgi:RNA polymerase sigma-70 factor (ECF subfamily)
LSVHACQHRAAMIAAADRVLHDRAAAEDVVQDVLVDLWRRPEAFDQSRGSLRTYVLMRARSRALDRWRTRSAQAAAAARATEEASVQSSFAASAADVAVQRDQAAQLSQVLGDLPASQREALLLAYARGLTAHEVARAVGVPLGTAKSRLRLGLKRARVALAE